MLRLCDDKTQEGMSVGLLQAQEANRQITSIAVCSKYVIAMHFNSIQDNSM